jgi:hypothetical protein
LLAERKRRSGVLEKTVVIVVFPRAVVLSVKGQELDHNINAGEQNLDFTNIDELQLRNADYEYMFTHPETCLSSKKGVSLFQSNVYKN